LTYPTLKRAYGTWGTTYYVVFRLTYCPSHRPKKYGSAWLYTPSPLDLSYPPKSQYFKKKVNNDCFFAFLIRYRLH
ncbi:hypothetical protein L9F63_026773, partial [Diploptera punctata]